MFIRKWVCEGDVGKWTCGEWSPRGVARGGESLWQVFPSDHAGTIDSFFWRLPTSAFCCRLRSMLFIVVVLMIRGITGGV